MDGGVAQCAGPSSKDSTPESLVLVASFSCCLLMISWSSEPELLWRRARRRWRTRRGWEKRRRKREGDEEEKRRRGEEADRVDQSHMTLEHISALQFKQRHHQLQGMQCWSQRACWVTVLQVCADKGLG